jgi:hypothetical protein
LRSPNQQIEPAKSAFQLRAAVSHGGGDAIDPQRLSQIEFHERCLTYFQPIEQSGATKITQLSIVHTAAHST